MPGLTYLDTSAIVKLVVEEDESTALRGALRGLRGMRALDAIHLASAQSLGDDLDALVAYDQRLLAAPRASGLNAEEPR